MTEKEVRDYVLKIKTELDDLVKKLSQIDDLRTIAENCTARTDKEPVQTSGSVDKMSKIVGRIVDLEREVAKLRESYTNRKRTVLEMSQKLGNERHGKYLEVRYVDGNSFYDTVMIMDLSDSTARRIDRKAISELTKVMNDEKLKI